MNLTFDIHVSAPFDRVLAATREALKAEGFGILTEIDLQAAFKEKLGREFRPYRILGACNPPLAFQAVSADPAIGILLPCNVTVEAAPEGGSTIRLTDPAALLGMSAAGSQLADVAQDARARLLRVQERLATLR